MMRRRTLIRAVPFVLALGTRTAAALSQRSYRGTVRYMTGARENGRETFSVTVQPDGLRTMRVQCEMDDDRLLRDVTITVDATWRPVTAFVQLTIAERLVGATWYRFSAEAAIAEGFTAGEGRISQRFALTRPADAFVAHPIHGDAWNLARLRAAGGRAVGTPDFASSLLPNGGSGPTLVPFPKDYLAFAMVGGETVKTPAGSFAAEHFTMTVVPKKKVMDVWAFGEDCIPVRMATEGRTYELVDLSGDPR
jgi:hypothetical protein